MARLNYYIINVIFNVFFVSLLKQNLKKNARPYGFTVRFRAKCDTNARLNALRFFMHFRAKFDKNARLN